MIVSVWATVSGCTSTSSEPSSDIFGSAYVVTSLQHADFAESVVQVRLSISAEDMPPRTVSLAQTAGQWGGIIGQIPAGIQRTFSAVALDASGASLFEGKAVGVTILPDQTVVVALTLQQVSPPDPFENSAPCITSIVANPATVVSGGTVSLVATAEDADVGDSLVYAWTATSGTFASPENSSTIWTAPSQTGPVTLTLTVTDSKGANATVSLIITVNAGHGSAIVNVVLNSWPSVTRIMATPTAVEVGETTSVTATAADNDGDTLAYAWTAGCAGTWADAASATAQFTPSEQPNTGKCANCPLTVLVSDGRGGQTKGTFSICVGPKPAVRFPPEIVHAYQSSLSAPAGATVIFQVGARDPQGSALSFSWKTNSGTLGTASHTASTSEMMWKTPSCVLSGTTPTIHVTVTNALGLSASRQFNVAGPPSCGDMSCQEGTVDCGGVCAELSTDAAHCGSCNNACRSGETCQQGSCACAESMTDCGEVCANLDSDPMHCGACGSKCPVGASCNSGQCVASCPEGQVSCNGYCVDVKNDSTNCGACGRVCGTGAACDEGVCACSPGDMLCNGVCVDAQSDEANCGGCGIACRADQACSSGQCSCPPGTTVCNGKCVDISSDVMNCGVCGRQCDAVNDVCVAGACTQTFTCQTNFVDGPPDCPALPVDATKCGAVLGTSSTDFDGSASISYSLNAAPNERFKVSGSAICFANSGSSVGVSFRSEKFPDVSLDGAGYAVYSGGVQIFVESEASPYACARPGVFRFVYQYGTPSYSLQLERYRLSGNYNTGGAGPTSATTLATGSSGRVCDQVCGTLKTKCATGEDKYQYYRLTIPPRRAMVVDAALQGGDAFGYLPAFRQDGRFICRLYGERLSANGVIRKRARLFNNSLVPQEVILRAETERGMSDYNLAFAVEP